MLVVLTLKKQLLGCESSDSRLVYHNLCLSKLHHMSHYDASGIIVRDIITEWTCSASRTRKLLEKLAIDSCLIQWNLAITKCHGTEKKNVRFSGVFVIAKTPL